MTTKKSVAKKAAPAKKATPAKAINPGKFAPDGEIKVLVDANPKRKGSKGAEQFANYKTGMTVVEALAKGVTRADLVWDVDHEFISIS